MIVIDPEFKNLLPPLPEDKYKELKANINEKGVLDSIKIWNGVIIDGHNRYAICQELGIVDFPVQELRFSSRSEVIMWMLSNNFARRDLTTQQKNEIALKYEKDISVIARKRMLAGKKPLDQTILGFNTRTEVAKIAGTSPASVMRTKRILEQGTPEQIERARRGEPLSKIVNEIARAKSEIQKKICNDCGRSLPLDDFYKDGTYYRNVCKSCSNTKYGQTKTAKRLEQANDLYNTSKVIAYTEDNFLTDFNLIAEECIRQLSRTFAIHKDVAPSNFGDIVAKKFANIIFE